MKHRYGRVVTTALLCLVLAAGILLGAFAAPAGINTASALGSLRQVGNLDLDGLRAQYLQLLENARYNYEGDRWAVVELKGASLWDRYQADPAGYADFAAYCASPAGERARAELTGEQAHFRAALREAGVDCTEKYAYTTMNNGLALRLSGEDGRTVSRMDGVAGVYFAEQYAVPKVAVSNNANVYTTGIYDTTGIDYKGEGMVVAILDTGLDYAHEAFATMPNSPAWSKEYVAARMARSSILHATGTADDVYYNAKVPFAWDYADDDPDVFPQYSSHGTHVAGIVAGKSAYQVAPDGETFLGVAPEAQLVIGKVFTDNLDSDSLGGANTIDILAAISDCVEMGVDVINMSLGSSAGFSDEKSDTFLNDVYARVKAAGISLVVAASNDYSSGFGGGNGTNLASNPDSGTVGSPSTYDAALSVASINGRLAAYVQANDDEDQVAFLTQASDENGNEFDFVELLYALAGKAKTETLRYKYVVVPGVGRPTNYTAPIKRALADKSGYDGTIALIRRGDITFAEKVQAAMDNGATACIIYNNVGGTIRMSLGEVENPVPTCAITMDAGKVFVDHAVRNVGTIQVNDSFRAGPFMSDFSSWGPTPDLRLRPEITAHGGEITSAVPGGYDVYSGTSMAAPNMSGAVALLRQHLKKTTGLTGPALAARVNQLLMSTATVALNEFGNPYSPRKQGAGLGGIRDAIAAEGYLTVPDGKGGVLDKTKIELGDDPKKDGVYTLSFLINNTSGREEHYLPSVSVMTETLSSDNKTVAERAYMLTDSVVSYTVDGAAHTGEITVPAGGTVSVTVRVELGDAGRKYLNESFENGMYVEGFVSLAATGDTKVTLGLPYLGFYGDWADAPLFDYSSYELAESQKDTNIPAEDKLVASAADTKIIGRYYDDKYILQMGAYLYTQDESDVKIYPEKEKIALSRFDEQGQRTIYELYMVYAGLLRCAAYMDITITDAATGDVVYAETMENVSKSYAAGGSNRGAPVMLEIRADEWDLVNNATYLVKMQGKLDWPLDKGQSVQRDSFDFQFTVDYEAPQVLDYRIRYDAYTENKQTKYRIYMDVDVYDNQYVQDVMPCYVREDRGERVLTLATEHPVAVYGQAGQTSTVSFEITDIYEEYIKTGKLYLAVEDYAMNQATYVIDAAAGIDLPDTVAIAEDGKLFRTDVTKENTDDAKTPYDVYELSLAPNELWVPSLVYTGDASAAENLTWQAVSGGTHVMTRGKEVYALSPGGAEKIVLQLGIGDGDDRRIYAEVELTVEGDAKDAAKPDKITLSPLTNGSYYVVNPESGATLELHPNMTVPLRAEITPWYTRDADLVYESSNPAVASVDAVGNITAHTKGTAYITVRVAQYPRLTKSVTVKVGADFRVVSYTLYDYYGGEECVIPKDLNIMYLDEDCFRNNTRVRRIVLPATLTEIPKDAFKGCTNLEEIVIPSQCIVVGESAFDGCAKLRHVTFGMFVDREGNESEIYTGTITIGRNAFRGCTSLSEIDNPHRMTTLHDGAFDGCTALASIDLTALRVAGRGVFRNCTALASVTLGENTAIGVNMFEGCTALTAVTYPVAGLPEGAFTGCSRLTNLTLTSTDFRGIGPSALAGTGLVTVTLPRGTYTIGEGAFSGCTRLRTVTLADGARISFAGLSPFGACAMFKSYVVSATNEAYTTDGGLLYNKDKTTLVAVPYAATLSALPASVRTIAPGAFAGVAGISALDLSGVTAIGEYAFAGSSLRSVTLPATLTALPDGVFSGCTSLSTVRGTAALTDVGAYAFANCRALTALDLPALRTVGGYAFRSSGLTSFTAPALERIGTRALMGTKIETLDLPALAWIGERAFSSMTSLQSVTLGPVTYMGDGAFIGDTALTDAVFGEGTTLVGAYAFYTGGASALVRVTLPHGVRTIGEFAFAGATGLANINLSDVTTIERYAFYGCTALGTADLRSVVTIGDGAFGNSGLTAADLGSAEVIGDSAFADAPLERVSFGALRSVGRYAFSGTALTEVTLPESFRDAYYIYTWDVLDEKGRVEETKSRRVEAFGAGAFANIKTLTAFAVEGNGAFVALDGVLYRKNEGGLTLLQYPGGRVGDAYTLADKTTDIGQSAFEGVTKLKTVELPYTVARIGAYAFYRSSVTHYILHSVEAPVLLAEYVDASAVSGDEVLQVIFARQSSSASLSSTIYYANFFDFVAKRVYKDVFNPAFYESQDFGLHLTIPKNGRGYDTVIWQNFFGDIVYTADNQPDNTTHAAMDRMAEAEAIAGTADIAQAATLADLSDIADAVAAARAAYNRVTLPEQKTLCTDLYRSLLAYEAALRDAKARLGAPVAMDRLELSAVPDKIRYTAGETFDPTGMVIRVVYADGSEITLNAGQYTLDKTVLHAGDTGVTVSYTDGGRTVSVVVLLNVQGEDPDPTPDPTPDEPDGPDTPDVPTPSDNGGLPAAAIAGIVVAVVLVLGGGTAAVILVLRRKKGK